MSIDSLRTIVREWFDEDQEVRTIVNRVFDHPKFPIWSGSTDNKHHYGDGGLAQHTYEVTHLCMQNALILRQWGAIINDKVLLLAAIFHDTGKMWDYEKVNGEWVGTGHKRNIHHISRSAMYWQQSVLELGICKNIHDDVAHCILAHHGRREWGSPVAPNSPEAWILHTCDMMSARVNDCLRIDYVQFRKKGDA